MLYQWTIPPMDADGIHHFVRSRFAGSVACLSYRSHLFVASDQQPRKQDGKSFEMVLPLDAERVHVVSRVSFNNVYRKQNVRNFYPQIDEVKALEKFCATGGLVPEAHAVAQLPPIVTRKFLAKNIFAIQGCFRIQDRQKFQVALERGLGGEKSYGYGLILVLDFERELASDGN